MIDARTHPYPRRILRLPHRSLRGHPTHDTATSNATHLYPHTYPPPPSRLPRTPPPTLQREFEATYKNDFEEKAEQQTTWQVKQAARRRQCGKGMLTWETLRNLPKVDAKDSESGFGALLPGMDHGHNELFATTTTGDAFGMGTKETKADKRFMRGPRAPIAGGPGSGRTEKGLRTSNAIGENVLSEADPQKNTEAQRSWLYSQDVMFENPGGPEAVSWGEMQHAMRCADAPMRRCADAPPPHCLTAPLLHCLTAPPLHCCAHGRSPGSLPGLPYGSIVSPHRTHL